MKRTSLLLDEYLLEELTRVSGERTYSEAVTKAAEDYLRRHRAGRELADQALLEAINRAYEASPDPEEAARQRAMQDKQRQASTP
jgi:metal-responsive CopG/Arc/MetJ family transcriptional regulator